MGFGINQPQRHVVRRDALSRSALRMMEYAGRMVMRSGFGLSTIYNTLGVFPAKPVPVPGAILFKIVSAQTARCQATAQVLGRPCGLTRVEEEDDNGYVTVYDVLCCAFADETDSALEGRMGWATRIQLDDSWAECCAVSYDYDYEDVPTDHCIWAVVTLCCPDSCLS